jgi:hypothetical protein
MQAMQGFDDPVRKIHKESRARQTHAQGFLRDASTVQGREDALKFLEKTP